MIRVIDLGNQINEWEEQFSFFDTVECVFIRVGVDYTFDSEADFIEAMEGDSKYFGVPDLRARMLRLIPDKFKKVNEVES